MFNQITEYEKGINLRGPHGCYDARQKSRPHPDRFDGCTT